MFARSESSSDAAAPGDVAFRYNNLQPTNTPPVHQSNYLFCVRVWETTLMCACSCHAHVMCVFVCACVLFVCVSSSSDSEGGVKRKATTRRARMIADSDSD